MLEADEAPNEVLVEDRMLTADSTFTLQRNKRKEQNWKKETKTNYDNNIYDKW